MHDRTSDVTAFPRPRKRVVVFLGLTALFLLTRWLTFQGFNGTDDLHYGLLAARLLQGGYDPFVPYDIWSGRVLLVAGQALVYAVGGVNPLTTQIGTLACTIMCAYGIVFHVMARSTATQVGVATALLYFNPVLTRSTLGILPDIYITLAATGVLVCWQKALFRDTTARRVAGFGLLCGLIVSFSLLIKETGFSFIPASLVMAGLAGKKRGAVFFLPMVAVLLVFAAALGMIYQKYTGDFFFKIRQLETSSRWETAFAADCPVPVTAGGWIDRLVLLPWTEFVRQAFYPVCLVAVLLVGSKLPRIGFLRRRFSGKPVAEEGPAQRGPAGRDLSSSGDAAPATGFVVLLLTMLFFPFNLHRYAPLCIDPRHFLFLLPFAIPVLAQAWETGGKSKSFRWIAAGVIFCGITIGATSPNKWKWLTYAAFVPALAVAWRIGDGPAGGRWRRLLAVYLVTALWVISLEPLIFFRSTWYQELKTFHRELPGARFYFTDHDNLMHWNLFGGFRAGESYDLETKPFPVFAAYDPPLTGFRPGWLIVNYRYSTNPPGRLGSLEALAGRHLFSDSRHKAEVGAYYLSRPGELDTVRALLGGTP